VRKIEILGGQMRVFKVQGGLYKRLEVRREGAN
jgi:hypothetical protein